MAKPDGFRRINYLSRMRIEEKRLTHWIDHFYGYGSWEAKVWFVAHEEGGGDLPEEVAEKLNYFFEAHPPGSALHLCDIRALYSHVPFPATGAKAALYATMADFRFGDHAVLHGVWKNLIAFLHAYRGKDIPDRLSYQRSEFASPAGKNEALIRLYPLPSPHNHGWYYSWLDFPELGFLKSRELYERHVYEKRISSLLDNIPAYKPEVVLMYGMSNINALKKSVLEKFPAAKFSMFKAIKREIPQHHRADIDGTTLVITTQIPALRHNRAESGFDWQAFGRLVRT